MEKIYNDYQILKRKIRQLTKRCVITLQDSTPVQ